MADGFLGRWSQRKQAVREGQVPPPAPPVIASAPATVVVPVHANTTAIGQTVRPGLLSTQATVAQPPEPAAKPLPTLDDVQALTAQDSYAAFTSPEVAPEVRNAAMKKLFTDPHYNLMDGLDTYIEDYSLPDPVPAAMLRQMASAQFLKLFDDEARPNASAALIDTPDTSPQPAQDHDHIDLRLQPDHAVGPPQSERGPQ